ncbi:MAG: flavin reductase family protein [Marinilabiliaceae bacterium]|nr:flavin reductase family protein [Marinilabiliaceae bacterium]
MAKQNWRPGNQLYPLPVVMVSCGSLEGEHNIITIAWTGTICSDPAMISVSIRKERHSYEMIKQSGEFVVNLTTEELVRATDWCGVKSGKDVDKFKEMNLTPIASSIVKAPAIKESPINIECKVKQIIPLGSHDMFIAEVVNVQAEDKYLDPDTGAFDLQLAKPICYSHGHYYSVGKELGKFGFSVKKNDKKNK